MQYIFYRIVQNLLLYLLINRNFNVRVFVVFISLIVQNLTIFHFLRTFRIFSQHSEHIKPTPLLVLYNDFRSSHASNARCNLYKTTGSTCRFSWYYFTDLIDSRSYKKSQINFFL